MLDVRGELLEVDDDGIGGDRERHELLQPLRAAACPRPGPRSSRCEILDRRAEVDRVGERQRAVRDRSGSARRAAPRRARGSTRARAPADTRRPSACATRKPCFASARAACATSCSGGAHFAAFGVRIVVAEEEVARELDRRRAACRRAARAPARRASVPMMSRHANSIAACSCVRLL